MDSYYIKNKHREYWTGRAWSDAMSGTPGRSFPLFAKAYDFDGATEVIEKRFARGIRKVTKNGEAYFIDKPKIVKAAEASLKSR